MIGSQHWRSGPPPARSRDVRRGRRSRPRCRIREGRRRGASLTVIRTDTFERGALRMRTDVCVVCLSLSQARCRSPSTQRAAAAAIASACSATRASTPTPRCLAAATATLAYAPNSTHRFYLLVAHSAQLGGWPGGQSNFNLIPYADWKYGLIRSVRVLSLPQSHASVFW